MVKKHRNISKLVEADDQTKKEKSHNTTTIVKKIDSKHPDKTYIYKENKHSGFLSEIESFNSLCLEVLLGERQAEARVIVDDQGESKGVTSKVFPDLITVKNYTNQNGPLTEELLISGEAVKIWVACYTEEETDKHSKNWGLAGNKFVNFDTDRTTWPLSAKHAGFDKIEAKENFKVSVRDIVHFPELQDAKPHHWPSNEEKHISVKTMDRLVINQKFQDDKHYMFLKRILVPDSVYTEISRATIFTQKMSKKFAKHKCEKTQELKNELFKNMEFNIYLANHPDAINIIIEEFRKYNESHKKEKSTCLHINLTEVENEFHHLHKQAMTEITEYLVKSKDNITTLLDNINKLKDADDFDKFIELSAELMKIMKTIESYQLDDSGIDLKIIKNSYALESNNYFLKIQNEIDSLEIFNPKQPIHDFINKILQDKFSSTAEYDLTYSRTEKQINQLIDYWPSFALILNIPDIEKVTHYIVNNNPLYISEELYSLACLNQEITTEFNMLIYYINTHHDTFTQTYNEECLNYIKSLVKKINEFKNLKTPTLDNMKESADKIKIHEYKASKLEHYEKMIADAEAKLKDANQSQKTSIQNKAILFQTNSPINSSEKPVSNNTKQPK